MHLYFSKTGKNGHDHSHLVGLHAGLGVLDGGLGEDGEDLGDAAVGDPDLGAVEDVVLAVGAELGAGLDAAGVGAGGRLGEGEGGKVLAGGHAGQVLLLLGGVA